MPGGPGAARVPAMANTAKSVTHEVTLWTEFVVAGERVYIRTRRPLSPASEQPESAAEKRTDIPEIEMGTAAPEAEP
jgi:hypothetical protein